MPETAPRTGPYTAEETAAWEDFRRQRWEGLAVRHGWLSLTGFQWLTEQPAALTVDGEGLPGRWWTQDGQAVLEAVAADGWVLRESGGPVDGQVRVGAEENGSVMWVERGDLLVEAGLRDGRWMLRVRDDGADLQRFAPLPVWPAEGPWRLPARWEPWAQQQTRRIGTIRPDTGGWAVLDGELVLQVDGVEHRLAGSAGGVEADGTYDRVTVTFHDRTNGVSSAAWRFLTVELDERARPGGPAVSAVADFNRSLNYPMAFSPHATCPAPVPENRLPFEVPAGEQAVRR